MVKVSKTHYITKRGIIKKNPKNYKIINKLKLYIKGAKISVALKIALNEIVLALQKKDNHLVTELTSVKGLITSKQTIKRVNTYIKKEHIKRTKRKNHFIEDSVYNEKKFGEDVYSYLSSLHFNYAMKEGTIPSGMTIISRQGIQDRRQTMLSSPTLDLMKKELYEIKTGY